mgnify:CR=1 FL=1
MPTSNKKPQLEGEVYFPSEEVIAQAHIKDWDALAEQAQKDMAGFWAKQAEELEWYQKWDKVLDDGNKPYRVDCLKWDGMIGLKELPGYFDPSLFRIVE